MEHPLVSIIIPAYNMESYIKNAIESALKQTYKNIEIIVVDDGSVDRTKEIIVAFARSGKVKYIYQKNEGLSGARNTGIKNAKGKYIALLDADDEFLPTKIERQVRYLEDNPECDMIYCGLWHFYDGKTENLFKLNYNYYSGKDVFKNLLHKNFINPLTTVFHKSVFERFGYFDEEIKQFAEDWEYWLRIAYGGAKICFLKEELAKYRIKESGSLSNDARTEVKRTKIVLSIFQSLQWKMSWRERLRYGIFFIILWRRFRLLYALLENEFKILRAIHLALQKRRFKAISIR